MTRLATRAQGSTELVAPCPYCCRADSGHRIRVNDVGQFVEHLAGSGHRCSGSGRSIESLGITLPGPSDAVDGRAAEVLVQHQRKDAGGCNCGWSVLGASYAEHVVEQLRGWGLLRDDGVRLPETTTGHACEKVGMTRCLSCARGSCTGCHAQVGAEHPLCDA